MTIEELQYFQLVLKKLRVDIPVDIDHQISRSREFSKIIKKKCGSYAAGATTQIPVDKKLKMTELVEMHQDSLGSYFVVTSEMLTLNDYISKAISW